ncbi:U6 snRNA phosphodiesterase [Gryllus bimaculatus]|nr:U6 snRNA phosphodiesterase [Gryllus bimaculatus]
MAVPSKSALSLLKDYDGSESSEEEVTETSSSRKRPASKQWLPSNHKKSNISGVERLPLPSLLKLSQDSQDPLTNDPELHDGRIRSFPHERGNWATYIYIPYKMTPSVEAFMDVVVSRLTNFNLKPVSDFHISLTKTVILRHHWIDLFVKSVQERTKAIPRYIQG